MMLTHPGDCMAVSRFGFRNPGELFINCGTEFSTIVPVRALVQNGSESVHAGFKTAARVEKSGAGGRDAISCVGIHAGCMREPSRVLQHNLGAVLLDR